jgi:ribosomal protein S18 acetylase RimI-like enzyme
MAGMVDPAEHRIRRASLDDLSEAATVLGDAFRDEPWTRWTIDARDHRARVEALQRLALEHVGFPFGEVWLAEVDGEIASVSVWMHSDRPVPDEVWAATAGEQERLSGDRNEAAVAAQEAVAAHRPEGRHLYLGTIGTAAAHAGRGLGRSVLQVGLDRADREGLPVHLETSSARNVVFYERSGFRVEHEVRLDGGPMVWMMRRPPSP